MGRYLTGGSLHARRGVRLRALQRRHQLRRAVAELPPVCAAQARAQGALHVLRRRLLESREVRRKLEETKVVRTSRVGMFILLDSRRRIEGRSEVRFMQAAARGSNRTGGRDGHGGVA